MEEIHTIATELSEFKFPEKSSLIPRFGTLKRSEKQIKTNFTNLFASGLLIGWGISRINPTGTDDLQQNLPAELLFGWVFRLPESQGKPYKGVSNKFCDKLNNLVKQKKDFPSNWFKKLERPEIFWRSHFFASVSLSPKKEEFFTCSDKDNFQEHYLNRTCPKTLKFLGRTLPIFTSFRKCTKSFWKYKRANESVE